MFIGLLMMAILTVVRWYHCGFNLHFSDDYLHWTSFDTFIGHLNVLFGEMSFQVLCPFFNWVVYIFSVEFYEFFINFGYYSLSDILANMFSHSVGCVFILLMVFFSRQKLFSLMFSCLFIFPFVSLAWADIFEIMLPWAIFEILLPTFSSRIFMVSGLTFKSLIHFQFILMYGIRR